MSCINSFIKGPFGSSFHLFIIRGYSKEMAASEQKENWLSADPKPVSSYPKISQTLEWKKLI